MTQLAFDKAVSFRWYDHDGRMHVDKSNLTRVQVAPYRGNEIPGWRDLKLDPTKIYHGYRPAEELSDPETIKSVVGIPIQLDHHVDYPDAPAMETRVGSTGDSAEFDGTYLSNSLHIQNEDACRRIRDGSMKQLSLAYHYEPDFSSSGSFRGQEYQFTMRKIRAQHLALVEDGRAGASCVVSDHALPKGENDMEDMKPQLEAKDDAQIENAEIGVAEAMGALADLLRGLHKTTDEGEHVDITNDDDKSVKLEKLIEFFASHGIEGEKLEELRKGLETLATDEDDVKDEAEDDEVEGEKTPIEFKEEDEDAPNFAEEEAEDEEDEYAGLVADGLKECGLDSEDEAVKAAFAKGVSYASKNDQEAEDEEPEEAEDEEEKSIAQDSMIKRLAELERREEVRSAIAECSSTIGAVREMAFDTAGDVFIYALKQKGVSMKGISKKNARAVYMGVLKAEGASRSSGLAQDSAPKTLDIASGIKVRI